MIDDTAQILENLLRRQDVIGPTHLSDDWRKEFSSTYVAETTLTKRQAEELHDAGLLDPTQMQRYDAGQPVPATRIDLEFLTHFGEENTPVQETFPSTPDVTKPRSRFRTYATAAVSALAGLSMLFSSYIPAAQKIEPIKKPVIMQVDTGYVNTPSPNIVENNVSQQQVPDILYTIRKGDTYEKIAAKTLGDRSLGFYLHQKNGGKNLFPGDVVNITAGEAIAGEKSRPWTLAKYIARAQGTTVTNIVDKMEKSNPTLDLNTLKPGQTYSIPVVEPVRQYAINTSFVDTK